MISYTHQLPNLCIGMCIGITNLFLCTSVDICFSNLKLL